MTVSDFVFKIKCKCSGALDPVNIELCNETA